MKIKTIKIITILIIGSVILPQSCRKIPPADNPPKVSVFEDCVIGGNASSFEIVTLNLQGFAKMGTTTISIVSEMIKKIDPDVIALQEMNTLADFNALLDTLNGWEGRFYPVSNAPWNLTYIFKTSEISIDNSKTRLILTGDSYAFPRAPFEIYVTHKTLNLSTYLINNHLKCCGGTDNEARRRDASIKLDNYIKSERTNDRVIVLGDFNDVISGNSNETNVFYNLVSSASEYRFTDMDIALGSPGYWSYPSYPSHIDHILITNELFGNIDTTMVLKPDKCYQLYWNNVSDHRPVELILK